MAATVRACDIMVKSCVTVRQDMDVWELARLLTSKGITGAPVVNEKGDLIGVVSQTDIIQHLREVASSRPWICDFYSESEPDRPCGMTPPVTAKDLMTASVIQAPEDATLSELRQIMLRHQVHRVIITRGRRCVGVVTTMDVLKGL